MSWARDALIAVKRIMLLQERVISLTGQSRQLMDACTDMDRRLVPLQAKFPLLERMAASSPRRTLTEKSGK
jgi:hypothetical protein